MLDAFNAVIRISLPYRLAPPLDFFGSDRRPVGHDRALKVSPSARVDLFHQIGIGKSIKQVARPHEQGSEDRNAKLARPQKNGRRRAPALPCPIKVSYVTDETMVTV